MEQLNTLKEITHGDIHKVENYGRIEQTGGQYTEGQL